LEESASVRQSLQNLRYAWRGLWKNAGHTSIILFTIALGIGANTAIFTVDYATLLAPPPYPQPDRLVTVWARGGLSHDNPSPENFIDWKRQGRAFQDLSAFAGGTFDIAQINEPQNIWGMRVSANYYRTLGSSFFLGRDFLLDEDHEGKNRVVILTHRLWSQLGADPKLVGGTMRVGGEPYTVVGVLQPGIADRDIFQMAVPLVFAQEELHDGSDPLVVVGRLRPGVTMMQAQEDMDAVTAHLSESSSKSRQAKGASVRPLREFMFSMSSDGKQAMWLLLGAVGFVLLIACVNVANLLLVKGMARQKEMAVRGALGATRRAIFTQMMMESLLLAITGGVLGIGLGYSMLRALLAAMPRFTLPWATDVRLNLPVLLFTLLATAFSGLLFGCIPAWYASRTDPGEALKHGGHAGFGVGRHRLQRFLVIAELSIALSLIAGAGLAVHSFLNLWQVDMGVRTDHVLTFYLGIPKTQSQEPEKIAAYYRQILSTVHSLPGVSSASAQTRTPLFPPRMTPFAIAGVTAPDSDSSKWPKAGIGAITPNYFKTFGIRLMNGRAFNEQDSTSGVRVAVVNQTFVRRFLNGVDPLRQHVWLQQSVSGDSKPASPVEWQVVGVYHDVLSKSMRDHPPEIQIPFGQSPSPGPVIAVRTAGDPDQMLRSITAAVHSVSPAVTVAQPRTMEQIRNQVLSSDRFSMTLFLSFGTVSLLLAILGVYGVMSFSVAERTREIALRMALGANRAHLVAWFVKQGVSLAITGLGLGLVGAYLVDQGMRSMLFGEGAIDFGVLGTVVSLLLLATLTACLVPARRAASVEPMQALKAE
jgi:putative ABC transport system permease protein